MIPWIATVAIRSDHRRNYRLWIPLGIIWLLLLPILLLFFPFFCIASVAMRINPVRAVATFAQILGGLKGLDLEVEGPRGSVEMRLL